MTTLPLPGDRVRVPWGFDIAEGDVVRTSDFGIGGLVTIDVEIDGVDEPFRVTFPVEAVQPLQAA